MIQNETWNNGRGGTDEDSTHSAKIKEEGRKPRRKKRDRVVSKKSRGLELGEGTSG